MSVDHPQAVFRVHLDNFDGPFDLLLGLIAKHSLDVTEVALSQVTDEFIAHIRASGPDWDLGQASEFLVVAATLLDLKAARLLPRGSVEDEEDLALFEARDLLFARLLQYRAYKKAAGVIAQRLAAESLRYPRTVGLDAPFDRLLPDLVLGLGPAQLAAIAARALRPRPEPTLPLAHLHAPVVSVQEQAQLLIARLACRGAVTFAVLTQDCTGIHVVVARFLALLELFRVGVVEFDQADSLGVLTVRWIGGEGSQARSIAELEASALVETEGAA